jgi:hypothetical protein
VDDLAHELTGEGGEADAIPLMSRSDVEAGNFLHRRDDGQVIRGEGA